MVHNGGSESEWLTRKKRIDPRLDALGVVSRHGADRFRTYIVYGRSP